MIWLRVLATTFLVTLSVCIVGSGVYHFVDLLGRYSWYTAALILVTHIAALLIVWSLIRDLWSGED